MPFGTCWQHAAPGPGPLPPTYLPSPAQRQQLRGASRAYRAVPRSPHMARGGSTGRQLAQHAAQLFARRHARSGAGAPRASGSQGQPQQPRQGASGRASSSAWGRPAVQDQLRKQQQWTAGGGSSQPASQQPGTPAGAASSPPAAAAAAQQPTPGRPRLPDTVEALFLNAESDRGLQERLRASLNQPSVFLRHFVGSRLEQHARHGLDESAVFKALMAARGAQGYREGDLAPILGELQALAEDWAARRQARTGSLMEPPSAALAASAPSQTPPALADTGAAELGYPPSQQQPQQQQGAAAASNGSSSGGGGGGPPAEPAAAAAADATTGAPAGGGRASIRDALNERGILLPQYTPGSYRGLCPTCRGGSGGEHSLSVTIEPGGRAAVWNCFRASCSQPTGKVSLDARTPDFTNDAGFPVSSVRKRKEEPLVRPSTAALEPPSGEVLAFLRSRGLGEETLARNRVSQQRIFVPASQREETVVAFPYLREGEVVNIKYRTLDKKFWQVKGAEKVLYGLDDLAGASEVVVVEGELDKLSLEEAGMQSVVSVPDGAPARVREGDLPPASEDVKFSYLWNCRAWLDQVPKVIIATDNDAPGDALAEELARRLGRERCWRVRWPFNRADHEYVAALAGLEVPAQPGGQQVQQDEAAEGGEGDAATAAAAAAATNGGADAGLNGSNGSSSTLSGEAAAASGFAEEGSSSLSSEDDSAASSRPAGPQQVEAEWYRKDANEVLLKDGPDMLRAFIENAEPLPIRGLLRFHEYYEDILAHYRLELKDAQGMSTGWPSLDALYQVVPGELTIVTGVPNSGKSEWIDALLCNLSDLHGWTFAMCSMEKKATDHARHLVEKRVGKPFFDLPYARGVMRMSQAELDEGLDWVDDRFHLIRYEDDNLPSVDWVLDIARAAVYRYGIRGLVIDPYNELDHQRPSSMTETEYVSQMLGKIKRFAQTCGVHVWFVAHPRQLREWKGQPPNLYDISGSAHFINKADNGIVVHRNRDPDAPNTFEVQILVRKVRNKAAGTIGDCVLEYDRVNGRYLDPENEEWSAPTSRRVHHAAQQAQQLWQPPPGPPAAGPGGGSSGGNGSGVYISQYGTLESGPLDDFNQ